MDPGKRDALVAWLDSFCEDRSITCINDVSSGTDFLDFISRHDCSKNFSNTPLSKESIFTLIRETLEGIYATNLTGESSIIDFTAVLHPDVSAEKLEFELAKILLALIGAYFHPTNGDIGVFAKIALTLPTEKQAQFLQMLEHVLSKDLDEEFVGVLSKKLVTTHPGPEASTPLLEQSFNFASRCINGSIRDSPIPGHHNSSVANLSVLEINSPLRMMSLNSPTPASFGDLMHSPQLMQKAQLRQKDREIKRLEFSLRSEQHLRCELEMDLKEKCSTLEQKEFKIRELEVAIREQRKLQDAVDELDQVHNLNEKLNQDLQSCKAKMTDFLEMKQQKEYFEKQHEETLTQLNQMEEAMHSLESLKKSHHEYRSKCHTQEVEISMLQTTLQHRAEEIEALKGQLSTMNEARHGAIQQFNDMKREKEELEEMFAATGMGGSTGENMGVVTDIRIRDLEAELYQLKSAWIDPIAHDQVKKDLLQMTEAKETYQTKFSEVHKDLLAAQSEFDAMQSKATSLEFQLTKSQQLSQQQDETIKSQTRKLREEQETLACVRLSEEGLQTRCQEMEESITSLKKELARNQAEYTLLTEEFEREKQMHETRRQTMTTSYDTVLSEKKSLEQSLNKEKASLMIQIEDLQIRLDSKTGQARNSEEVLKTKLAAAQNSVKQTEIVLENERWTKDNVIKALKEEMTQLKEEIKQTEEKLNAQLREARQQEESTQWEITQRDQSIEELRQQLEAMRSQSREEQDQHQEERNSLTQDLSLLQSEKERLKANCVNFQEKIDNMSVKNKSQLEELQSQLSSWQDKHQLSVHDNQKSVEQLSELKAKIEEKEQKFESLNTNWMREKEKNVFLSNRVSDLESDYNAEKCSSENKTMEVNRQKCEIETLQRSLNNTRQENDEFKMEILELKTSYKNLESDMQNTVDDMKNDISKITSQNKKLQSEHENLQMVSMEKEQTMKKELNRLEQTRNDLENRLQQEIDFHQEQLRQHEVASEQNQKINVEVLMLRQHLNHREAELETVREEVQKKQDTLEENSGQMALVKKIAEVKQADNEQLQQKIQQLEKKVKEMKERELNLNKAQNRMKTERDQFEKRLQDMETTVGQLSRECDSLEVEKNKLNGLVANLRSSLGDVRAQRDELQTQIDQLTTDKAKQVQIIYDHEEEAQELQQKITSLKEEVDSLTKQTFASQSVIQQSASECERLKEKNNRLETEIQTLSCQLNDQSQQRESLQSRNQDLEGQVINLHNELETEKRNLHSSVSEKDEAQRQVETLTEEITSLESDLNSKTREFIAELKEKGQYITQLEERNKNLESNLSGEKIISERLLEEKSDLDKMILDLNENSEHLRNSLKQIRVENSNTLSELESLISRNNDMENELNLKVNECDNLVKEKQSLCEMIETLKTSVNQLTSQQEQNLNQLGDMSEKFSEANKQLECKETEAEKLRLDYENSVEEKKQVISEYGEQIRTLCEEHQENVSALKEENSQLKQKSEEELKSLVVDITATNHELKDARDRRMANERTIVELEKQCKVEREAKREMKAMFEKTIQELQEDVDFRTKRYQELENQTHRKLEEKESYWRAQLAQLENEYSRASEEVKENYSSEMTEKLHQMTHQYEAMVAEKEGMLSNQRLIFQDRVSHLENRVAQRQREVEDARGKAKKLEDLLTEELTSHRELKSITRELKDKIMDKDNVIKERNIAIAQLQMTASEKETDIASSCQQISTLQQDIQFLQDKVQCLSEDIENQTHNTGDLQKEVELYKEERDTALAEVNSYKQQLDAVEAERDKWQEENEGYSEKLEKFQENFNYKLKQAELKVLETQNQKENAELSLKNEIHSWQKKLYEEGETKEKLENELKQALVENEKAQRMLDSYKVHYSKKKELIEIQNQEVEAHRNVARDFRQKCDKLTLDNKVLKQNYDAMKSEAAAYKSRLDKAEKDLAPIKEELQAECLKNKLLNNDIRSVKVQLDHATRQLRDLNKNGCKVTENAELFSTNKVIDSIKMQDHEMGHALFGQTETKMVLRPREAIDSLDDSIFMESPHKKEHFKTVSNITLKSEVMDALSERRMSLRSHSQRLSSCDMNQSLYSTSSTASTASVPRGVFHCEDEPEEFEWNRLTELQRRNTLCPAHLKTSYPVETQHVKPQEFTDDALRYSMMPSGKKRKNEQLSDEDDTKSSMHLRSIKQAKHGSVPQKSAPLTPAKPETPSSARKSKKTPKKTPGKLRTPKLSTNRENSSSVKKSRLGGLKFSIGFTPKDKNKENTKSTSKVGNLVKLFEAQGSQSSQNESKFPTPVANKCIKTSTPVQHKNVEMKSSNYEIPAVPKSKDPELSTSVKEGDIRIKTPTKLKSSKFHTPVRSKHKIPADPMKLAVTPVKAFGSFIQRISTPKRSHRVKPMEFNVKE
ncbi:nuclear mitotic apparatus protein 1-like isoform X2 [Ostrea edulis]|uniref:nuclear mitotic apparatus protein 1-like isoform X2 n=1 Tax=Ostrea edulis TaxID=37623 RepID=UPI0024AF4A70|nr:nuclear mitotic apparatus protein 1-like isoform X2 [Ostrea edulis]XP_056009013.1 nuclear mitotic apparatus protein 1-like isoform X2 [Ostrea edulis]